jgi:hypothetical protein
MLTPQNERKLIELFDKVLDAYVSSASDAALSDIYLDEDSDELYDEPEYKYEMSRISSITEEWKKELQSILDGKET